MSIYASRWYEVRYTVPGDTETRKIAKATRYPDRLLKKFKELNPSAVVQGVYDQATGTPIAVV
jgi:hypothetical protein